MEKFFVRGHFHDRKLDLIKLIAAPDFTEGGNSFFHIADRFDDLCYPLPGYVLEGAGFENRVVAVFNGLQQLDQF